MGGLEELFSAIEQEDIPQIKVPLERYTGLLTRRMPSGEGAVMKAIYQRAGPSLALLLTFLPPLDIFEASAAGDVERVEELLAEDSALASRYSQDGRTPLHLSAHFGQTAVARTLLQSGADIRALSRNGTGNQPLEAGIAGGAPHELVKLLIESGADVNDV